MELILVFYTLTCLVWFYSYPASLLSGPWLTGILSSCYLSASITWHWPSVKVNFAIFISVLIFLLISLLHLAFSRSPVFFVKSPLLSQRSRISEVIQGFLFRRCLLRSLWSTAVSIAALLKWMIMESKTASSSSSMARGANLLSVAAAWKATTVGSFSFSRSNPIVGWFGFLDF